MSPDDVNALLDRIESAHRAVFERDPRGEIFPSFMVGLPNGETEIIATPWETAEAKAASLLALKAWLRDRQATFYCLWSETWMGAPEYGGRASEDPNRKEGVVTAYVPRSGVSVARFLTIHRDDKGGVTRLARDPDSQLGGGAMLDLFDRDTVQ